jgi:hypothetical protein
MTTRAAYITLREPDEKVWSLYERDKNGVYQWVWDFHTREAALSAASALERSERKREARASAMS